MKVYYEAGKPIPKSLGIVADQLKQVSEIRLLMDKEVKEVKERETELREHLIEHLSKDETGVSGKKYHAQVKSKPQPTVDDWELVWDFVVEKDAFHILGKSLNAKAVKEIWDNGDKIPGVSVMQAKSLSITKVK